jgi:hypothetical protein
VRVDVEAFENKLSKELIRFFFLPIFTPVLKAAHINSAKIQCRQPNKLQNGRLETYLCLKKEV